ncbi:hypothetical protein [Streptomyces colonosanans]|nr:hypothetical protein [Streptomyces colonosanans]
MIDLKHDCLFVKQVTTNPAGAAELVHEILKLILRYVLSLGEPFDSATA